MYKEDSRSVAQKMSDVCKDAKNKEKSDLEQNTQKQYPSILLEIERMSKNKCGTSTIEGLLTFLPKDDRVYICWETLVVLLNKDGFLVHSLRNSSGNLTTNSSVSWGEENLLRYKRYAVETPKPTWWARFKVWMVTPIRF